LSYFDSIHRFRLHVLPLAVATIVAATAIPAELRGPVRWSGELNPLDVAQNLMLYVPLGAALWRRPSWLVLVTAALFSCLIEFAQVWMINRDPSPVDVAANAAGALAGAVAWRRAGFGVAPETCTSRLSSTSLAGLAILAALILLAWGLPVQSPALSDWNPDYPLQLGNEATQDRAWSGVIHRLVLRPSAKLPHQATGSDTDEGVIERTDPIILSGGRRIVTPEAASRAFADAAMRENSFTVIARVTAADAVQDGPARIVSFSVDPFHRNFDLGQQGRSVVLRVRTPVSGPNGENFRVETAPILSSGEATLIVASYDGAVARIHVNGRLQGRRNIAAAGCSAAFMCGSAVPIAWAVLGAVATLIALALIPWNTRKHALGIAVLGAAVAVALPRLLHVGSVPLATQPWAQLVALLGATAVAIAVEPPRSSARARSP
jgi:hypothetical protein